MLFFRVVNCNLHAGYQEFVQSEGCGTEPLKQQFPFFNQVATILSYMFGFLRTCIPAFELGFVLQIGGAYLSVTLAHKVCIIAVVVVHEPAVIRESIDSISAFFFKLWTAPRSQRLQINGEVNPPKAPHFLISLHSIVTALLHFFAISYYKARSVATVSCFFLRSGDGCVSCVSRGLAETTCQYFEQSNDK